MSDLHATSLAIAGFRGVRRAIELKFGRRLTIIYGGNATGKSSIAQAIEFALSGQIIDHEDRPIQPHYLNNSLALEQGIVNLQLSDGSMGISLHALTSETRTEIEQRFRKVGSVDWPERQHLPITTTHVTSQGALARVLTSGAVTRNDLSGLCAGAQLRYMLSRTQRLSDHFRQAATGRNMQTEIKEARSAFESARVLHQSLAATQMPEGETITDPGKLVSDLATSLGLPETASISEVSSVIDARAAEIEKTLVLFQRLLGRMRELGQYEVEVIQLRRIINDSIAVESDLTSKREEMNEALQRWRSKESGISSSQADAAAKIAAHERYHQSASILESLTTRLGHAQASLPPLDAQLRVLQGSLEKAATEQRTKSAVVADVETSIATQKERMEAIDSAIGVLSDVPDAAIALTMSSLEESESALNQLRQEQTTAADELRDAANAEIVIESELKRTSESESRYLAAVSELRNLIQDDTCTLCGHRHGSRENLEAAIAAISKSRVLSSNEQRARLEHAAGLRRIKDARYTTARNQTQAAQTAVEKVRATLDQLLARRSAAFGRARELLIRFGSGVVVALEPLSIERSALVASISEAQQELELARRSLADSSLMRNDLERELAERIAERDQVQRLSNELSDQLERIRSQQQIAIPADALAAARHAATSSEGALAEVRLETGKLTAELTEVDRLLIEIRAQRGGAQRRLELIEGLLVGLDAELRQVGATRDVTVLLSLESSTRQRRDELVIRKADAASIQRQLRESERRRSYIDADLQFRNAQTRLTQLQRRQEILNKRTAQFARLQGELEKVQKTTAESVLDNVKIPVATMFRAMTAGCQWDIEFSLTEDGRVEASLVDGIGGALPASSVLNSAYLNVSAIALRIALASQQNWTSLRTVVLDDPILEMDSLTQSALVDGLEAILGSPHSPWRRLQLIMTTWSEDFAVLAAHKLAHLNADEEDFVIYRLGSLPDGTVVPDRHTPRWKAQAHAA